MEGPVWRTRGVGSRLALVTSLFMISSLFVIVGAQVASAAQCGQVNNPPACSLAFRFENPANSGVYNPPAPGYSSPHQAAVGETITSTDLDPKGPSVIVEVEDAFGHRDTNYNGQITLTISSGTGKLTGGGPVTAVKGAASFTNLSIDAKGDFQLAATASPSTSFTVGTPTNPLISGPFRIWADRCVPGETCKDSFQTLMEASLTNGGTGTVALSVGIDGVDVRAGGTGLTSCSVPATPTTPAFTDPWFHAPAETTVDEVGATGNGIKVVVLRIKKAWRLMVPDNGASSYRGCVTALLTAEQARTITTWNNSPITETAPGQWTFLVPDCTKTIKTFCRDFTKSNGADVIEGLAFPSGAVFGDPRGH